MQVILLEKRRGLGDIGDIVAVKKGFARNYLLPRGKVLRASAKNKELLDQKRAVLEEQNDKLKAEAEKKAEIIAQYTASSAAINIFRPASDDGKLYGAVTVRDVKKSISDSIGVELASEEIVLNSKIKQLGVFPVELMLHPDVKVSMSLNIARHE